MDLAPEAPTLRLMDQPIITATALTKVYGEGATEVRALDGVDFVVAPGEFVAIMGPSGSGKSTLLHIVGALEPADGWDGRDRRASATTASPTTS